MQYNRHHNLTLRVAITRYVAWKLLDIRDKLRKATLCRCATHASAEFDRLTCDLPMKGTQDELTRG